MTSKQKIKQLKKQNDSLRQRLFEVRGHLASANKTVLDLMEHSNMQERHQRMTEDALSREWIIREYLEDRNVELIRAMAG